MAVYIRFNNPNLSPMTCGKAINPATLNWNKDGGLQNCEGNSTRGTNILAWLSSNDPQFSAFCNNNMRNLVGGVYRKDFVTYGQDRVKIRFRFEVNSTWGKFFDFGVSVEGGTSFSAYSTRMCWDMSQIQANDYTDLLLGAYGPYFIVNPYNQDSVTGWGVVYKACPPYSNSYYKKDSFLSFYDFDDATNRATLLNIIFGNSKQDTGPDSTEDGGWGSFDDGTETIGLPGVPSISALDTGFVRMYNPTAQELQQFASFIWSTDFFTNVIKNFSDPMQAIVSLAISPIAPTVSQQETNIVVGNLPAFIESESSITPIMAAPLTSQYVTVNCGSITLNEYWGSALDYSPYSKCEIYLPYIGVQNLSIDDVMGSTLTLQYNVDLLTGICTAVLKCVKSQHMDFDAALYHWSGNLISNLPISGSNFAQVITALTSSIVSAGIPIVTGAGGAAIASGVVGGVMNMMNAKAQVQKSGSISMQSGALDNQTPYLILTRPIQSKAANYPAYKGWTTNITAELGSLSGYTEVEYIHVEVAGATDEERNEIERLLKEGVII